MKIVCWNLLNIAQSKLPKPFTFPFAVNGMGNFVLQYMVNLVMNMDNPVSNNPIWDWTGGGFSTNPADVFVIIELKTGGTAKGGGVTGNCTNTLATIVNAMNQAAVTRNLQGNYQYAYATPLITGRHEAVGVIYNTILFPNPPLTFSLRDNNNNFISPRTPFMVSLIDVNGDPFDMVGIHAPPVKGGAAVRYRPPIDFMRKLGIVDELNPNNPNLMINPNLFIMGDFNCTPASTYTNGLGQVINGFTQLAAWNYGTLIPNGTLSSYRVAVNNGFPPPANYLSEAYDNLVFAFDQAPNANIESVLNLIQYARNSNNTPVTSAYVNPPVALLNNNRKVSDHQPMIIEFN